jgi:hypothetical protein
MWDCVVADAVGFEPVSTDKFPVTGKLTGNFAKFGLPPRISGPGREQIQWLPVKFPTQKNRELF